VRCAARTTHTHRSGKKPGAPQLNGAAAAGGGGHGSGAAASGGGNATTAIAPLQAGGWRGASGGWRQLQRRRRTWQTCRRIFGRQYVLRGVEAGR